MKNIEGIEEDGRGKLEGKVVEEEVVIEKKDIKEGMED